MADPLLPQDLFAGLPEEKIERIRATGRLVSFDAGQVILREGEPSNDLYVIQQGMVEILVSASAIPDVPGPPKTTPVVALGRGQVFGEMALVDQGARSATVRCAQDGTTLFVLPRDAFWRLCEEDTAIGYVVMRNIARDLSFKLRHRNLRLMAEG